MATKLSSIIAGAALAAGIASSGCIQEDCLDTYFLDDNTRTVSIEPEFTERVRDISLTMEARNNPWDYMGEHAYAENLRLKCAPSTDNNCLEGYEYEFFVNYITPGGERIMAGGSSSVWDEILDIREFELREGAEGGRIECRVWSPACTTKGFFYRDENGDTQIYREEYRPRTLVGSVTEEVGLSLVCPAPISPFKPVSDADLQNSSR